jgi:pimeloyl-ACP methyl ester carboxylesterase
MQFSVLFFSLLFSLTASAENSKPIDQLEKIQINGTSQWLLYRGERTDLPILLFVHGGPGAPLMYFSRAFDQHFTKDFLVVHWDQRGTGKSYDPDLAMDSFTAEQVAADGLQVVNHLKKKFGRPKILLVGHSWGTIVASWMTQKAPEDFTAYVSVGTVADIQAGDEMAYAFLQDNVFKYGDKKDKADFKQLGHPPWKEFSQLVIRSRLMMKFKGSFFSLDNEQINAAVNKNSEYSKEEMKNIDAGMEKIWHQILPFLATYKAIRFVKEFSVPVIFAQGKHDMATPAKLSRAYYDQVAAKKGKQWVEFANSAHFPMYEEPEKFLGLLKTAGKM